MDKYKSINLWIIYIFIDKVDRSGWVRLFGKFWGIHWKHKDNGLLFSERYGYTKLFRIGNYNFKFFKK